MVLVSIVRCDRLETWPSSPPPPPPPKKPKTSTMPQWKIKRGKFAYDWPIQQIRTLCRTLQLILMHGIGVCASKFEHSQIGNSNSSPNLRKGCRLEESSNIKKPVYSAMKWGHNSRMHVAACYGLALLNLQFHMIFSDKLSFLSSLPFVS